MKISILTFAKGDNYGAVLQAYALRTVLSNYGHDVEFINYTWNTFKESLISRITGVRYKFGKFRKKYLGNFTKKCSNYEDLKESVLNTDLCIVGSDQVWNPGITTFRALHYFFDFLPTSIPRISYAASFGVKKWKWPELIPDVSDLLSKFNSISVRETSGIDICSSTFNCDAIKVMDPTLLLYDYTKFIKKPIINNYILGYKFIPSSDYYKLLEYISTDTGSLSLIMDMIPRKINNCKNYKVSFAPSPEHWLTNIAYSNFVVTDSFHCTVFSIIFRKNFIVIIPSELNKVQDRIYTFLKDLGLEKRIFNSIDDALKSHLWHSNINYDKITPILSKLRQASLDYLLKAVENSTINSEA